MESKKTSLLKPILISICNFNFLGIGYLLIGQKKRWMIAFGGTLAVLLIAHFANAPENPWLWAAIFLAILIGMAVDLWLLLKKDPSVCDKVLKNNLTLLIVMAALLVMIFGGGFYFYRWMGEDLYWQGVLAYQNDDMHTAFKDLYSVSNLYRLSLNPTVLEAQDLMGEVSLILDSQNRVEASDFITASDMVAKFEELYPDSPKLDQVKNIGIDAYIGAARQLTASGEFEASLEKLTSVKTVLPVQAEERKTEIDEVLAANYLAWGQDLYGKQEFESSIEKFEIVTAEYENSESYTDAYTSASLAHYDYAMQLEGEKQYDLAWENYLSILEEYKTAYEYENAKARMSSMLLDWGKSLASQDHYLLAIEKFDLVSDYSVSSDFLAKVDEEKQATVLMLANDNGIDGQTVLSEAVTQACVGDPVSNPSVGILEDEPKKALACYAPGLTLPDELMADKPGDLAYVIDRIDDSRRVQSCDYVTSYDTRTLERWQYYSEIIVKDVLTGETIYDKTFYGSSPESCPYEYYFWSMTEYLYGDYVDEQKITDWLSEALQ